MEAWYYIRCRFVRKRQQRIPFKKTEKIGYTEGTEGWNKKNIFICIVEQKDVIVWLSSNYNIFDHMLKCCFWYDIIMFENSLQFLQPQNLSKLFTFYQNLHILWYPSFRTFSFHDSLLQKYCIFGVSNIFTTLQLGNMKQRKGFILLRYFSILQRYFFISQR